MRLLTLNCHSWQEENQIEKIKHIAKTIVGNDYDAIALQEVSQTIDAEEIGNGIKEDNYILVLLSEIKKLGGADYRFFWDFSHIGYGKYEEGLAVLSKHEIIDRESFFVSESRDPAFWKTRKIVRATIDYDGSNIDIYSCHLGWWGDKDEEFIFQAEKLYQKIEGSSNLAFVMGDFNNDAFVKGEGYDYLKILELKDSYEYAKCKDDGYTVTKKIDGWENNSSNLRLDIIFTNKEIDILKSRVIFNGVNGEIVSDHYGVEIIVNR